MATHIVVEALIKRPREEVAAYATNPDNDTTWISGVAEANMLTEPPLDKGTQVQRVAHFLGRRIEYVLEVDQWSPGSLMAMRSVKGPFPMEVTYQFEDAAEGTLARISVRGEASGFFKFAAPILAKGVEKNVIRDLMKLKRLLESGAGQG